MQAVVIGAGVIGASVALRLAQSGARTLLLEAGRVCSGTSLVSFAWVSSCEKIGNPDYFRLSKAAVAAHHATAEEFGAGQRWFRRPGVIQWDVAEFEDPAAGMTPVARKAEALTRLGYAFEEVDAAALARMEPSLAPDALEGGTALHYPEDGYLEAPVYVGAMVESAVRDHGAVLRQNAPVRRVLLEGGRVTGVELASGERIGADVVVNCAGRWANEASGEPALQVPLAPTVGLIAYTPSVSGGPKRVLRTPRLNLREDGAGRFLLRANDIDREAGENDPALPGHPVAQKLIERLWQLVPELAGVPVEAARIAVRPIPKGGLPCVGPVPGIEGYFMAVTHGGINTSAFIGMALRDEIIHGRPAPEYAPFRPARFFKAQA